MSFQPPSGAGRRRRRASSMRIAGAAGALVAALALVYVHAIDVSHHVALQTLATIMLTLSAAYVAAAPLLARSRFRDVLITAPTALFLAMLLAMIAVEG